MKAGCEQRMLNDAFRMRSPLRGADVRWVRALSANHCPPCMHCTGAVLGPDLAGLHATAHVMLAPGPADIAEGAGTQHCLDAVDVS